MELDLSSATLLIVDDNVTNLSVISDYLETYGFRILVARNGESAIERARYAQPDLILLDVMMPPGINGFETCLRLKQDEATKDIPVLFMTALAQAEDKVKGFEAGGVDYVTKPIQQAEVLARVITHLKIKNLTQHLQEKNKTLEELNTTLEDLNTTLADMNASKDKFFYIMSHDLRAPFNALMGSSQLLIEDIGHASDEKNRELAESIYDASKATYQLLENLLSWARLQLGRMVYKPTAISVVEQTENVFFVLKEMAKSKGIQLICDVNDNVFVYADPHMFNTIIRNLVANAIKFTPSQGKIIVKTLLNINVEDFVEVWVKDTGVGILPEDLEKIFKLDEYLTTQGTNNEKGTGLGLMLCKEMVEKNGGEIWVESQLNAGTTVKFTVPIAMQA